MCKAVLYLDTILDGLFSAGSTSIAETERSLESACGDLRNTYYFPDIRTIDFRSSYKECYYAEPKNFQQEVADFFFHTLNFF